MQLYVKRITDLKLLNKIIATCNKGMIEHYVVYNLTEKKETDSNGRYPPRFSCRDHTRWDLYDPKRDGGSAYDKLDKTVTKFKKDNTIYKNKFAWAYLILVNKKDTTRLASRYNKISYTEFNIPYRSILNPMYWLRYVFIDLGRPEPYVNQLHRFLRKVQKINNNDPDDASAALDHVLIRDREAGNTFYMDHNMAREVKRILRNAGVDNSSSDSLKLIHSQSQTQGGKVIQLSNNIGKGTKVKTKTKTNANDSQLTVSQVQLDRFEYLRSYASTQATDEESEDRLNEYLRQLAIAEKNEMKYAPKPKPNLKIVK